MSIKFKEQSDVTIIANSSVWLEGAAIEQLQTTAKLPGMIKVAGMPDLHPGRGYPIGASFLSNQAVYPALVGNDIGCGMSLYQTDLPKHKWSGTKLAEKIGNIDGSAEDELSEQLKITNMESHPYRHSLGTIGGGNHFTEFQQIDELYVSKEELQSKYSFLNPKLLQLIVHSGSRGFGEHILREHIDAYGHSGLVDQEDIEKYMLKHNDALNYAHVNRSLIATRILLRLRASAQLGLDIFHNFVEPVNLEGGATGYLHRKGATPSNKGLVVIPGSRGDYSYLVEPTASDKALFSLAHGAGRKWMRSDCESKLGKFNNLEALTSGGFNSTVVCENKALFFEEAPQAYKKSNSIVDALEEFGLIHKIARLKPVMTYKTKGGCAC